MVWYLLGIPTAIVTGLVANLLTEPVRKVARSRAGRDRGIVDAGGHRQQVADPKIREDTAFIERLRTQPSATVAYVGQQGIRIVFAAAWAVLLNAAALVLLLNPPLLGETVLISVAGLVMIVVLTFRVRRGQDLCRRIYAEPTPGPASGVDGNHPDASILRKAGGGRPRPSGRTASSRQRSSSIRSWAKDQGIAVNERGRIPASVVEQYEAANGRL
jgi:Lsr2